MESARTGRSYQDLIVWRKAMDLVEAVYGVTDGWPQKEARRLTDQVCRAAISIPANVAEGQGRYSSREFLRFCSIANGSLYEVETHLLIARRLKYLDESTHAGLMQQAAEIGRLLHGLMKSLRPPHA
jgi:four helix bundle protein